MKTKKQLQQERHQKFMKDVFHFKGNSVKILNASTKFNSGKPDANGNYFESSDLDKVWDAAIKFYNKETSYDTNNEEIDSRGNNKT